MEQIDKSLLNYILRNRPSAVAEIRGGEEYPQIRGMAEFYALPKGVAILTDVTGLPKTQTNIFAYHIHSGDSCDDGFEKSLGHYNPSNAEHPNHAGDMPPLFAFGGDAFSLFYTERFNIGEVEGKTVIIHSQPDDFTTQPSGNSGDKIACGVIK